ncbi:hypothetical protein, conserved [Eimeria acervulina]|uniref:Transmembrane protein n=1 Tax=Eimeria acervulina TaxID=5801 RepID=U6GJ76_EIMAC|nr:hypothetical protein, conserved [Eimeria acervulina]CDI80296.1 hypothetical protein, conserved [Eimeria acervulina]
MVSPSGGPPKGPSTSPQGPHQGSSSGRGAPNPDVVRGASPSISTTDDSSRRDCSPSWAPPPYPSSQMGGPRGPPWGPQGKPAAARSHKGGAPLHSAVSVEGVGPHISSRRPVEGSLSLRGPRGAPHRSTGFSSAAAAAASAAAADSEVYVHLTDGESASSADEGEEMRVRAGSSNEWSCSNATAQQAHDEEVLSFPKKNFALMGCLDGVCGIMAVVGGVHTSEVVPLNELWRRLVDGGRCLLGVNIIVPPVCGPDMGLACDSCQGAWVEVAVYIIFNLIYNVCSMLVLKHCGATVLFLIMTVRLPLTSMAFYSKLIVGDSAVPAKPTDFFGLLVLLVGLLAFRLGGHKTACFSDEEMPTPRGRRRQRQPEVYTPPNPQPDAPEEGGGPGGLFVGGPRRR